MIFPPLSFIIPAFNCQATLRDAILSIVNGNIFPGDEIVVVDDGSTDNTSNVASDLAKEIDCVRLIRLGANKGPSHARNLAVSEAVNSVIFCLDSDNLLAPSSVEYLRLACENNRLDGAAFREIHYFLGGSIERVTHIWRYHTGSVSLADYLDGNIIPGASGNYLFTKAAWRQADGYPEYARSLDTWGFGLRKAGAGLKIMVQPFGFYYHRHGHRSNWIRNNDRQRAEWRRKLLLEQSEKLSDKARELLEHDLTNDWWKKFLSLENKTKEGEIGRVGEVVWQLTKAGKMPNRLKRFLASLI